MNLKCSHLFISEYGYCSSAYGGMRSNGSVSLKQASNTLSTTSSASCLLMSFTHNMDFTARSFTHSCQIEKLTRSSKLQCLFNVTDERKAVAVHVLFTFYTNSKLAANKQGCH